MKGKAFMISSLITASLLAAIAMAPAKDGCSISKDLRIESERTAGFESNRAIGSFEADWVVGLPLKSKIIEVKIPEARETLKRASDNATRRNRGDKLVIATPMIQLSAGESVSRGSEVVLTWPKPDHPLVDDNGEIITAKLKRNARAPQFEELSGSVFDYRFQTNSGLQAQLVGVTARPYRGDSLRREQALTEAIAAGDFEGIEFLERFPDTETLSGFLVLRLDQENSFKAFPVTGEKFKNEITFSAGHSSLKFGEKATELVEIYKAYSYKTKTEDELRVDFEPTAESLIAMANETQSRFVEDIIELSGIIQNPAAGGGFYSVQGSVSDAEAFDLKTWISDPRFIHLGNFEHLQNARQQMQLITIGIPDTENHSELRLAGIMTQYNADFPSDYFACGSHVPLIPMTGKSFGGGSFEFSRLDILSGPYWNLSYAKFDLNGGGDSYILSWTFEHADSSYLKKRKLIWGGKAFVNPMSSYHLIPLRFPAAE